MIGRVVVFFRKGAWWCVLERVVVCGLNAVVCGLKIVVCV